MISELTFLVFLSVSALLDFLYLFFLRLGNKELARRVVLDESMERSSWVAGVLFVALFSLLWRVPMESIAEALFVPFAGTMVAAAIIAYLVLREPVTARSSYILLRRAVIYIVFVIIWVPFLYLFLV